MGRIAAFVCISILLGGCASVKVTHFGDIAASVPPPAAGSGRIFVYRGNEVWGSGSWEQVVLNDHKVGPHLFAEQVFYLDRPAGHYSVDCERILGFMKSAKHDLEFDLNPGEIKYVRIKEHGGVGALSRHGLPELEGEVVATTTINKDQFTEKTH